MARLDEIAELLCVNSRWLRTGEGVKHPKVPISNHTTCLPASEVGYAPNQNTALIADKNDIHIPFYNEVLSPCGTKKTRVVEIPDNRVRLDCSILHAADVSAENAICVPMIGHSMSHKIQSGSTIAIDRSLTHIVDGEIYALEQDGMLRIKYVYRQPKDGLRLRSHNAKEYPDEVFSAEHIRTLDIRILGWVFWWSTLNTRRPAVPSLLNE